MSAIVKFRLVLIILGWLVSIDGLSQEDFPTVDAIESATSPAHNPVDMAHRLYGIDVSNSVSSPIWQIGDTQHFTVTNSDTLTTIPIQAELLGMSATALVWVDETVSISQQDTQTLADVFDNVIYPQVNALWGIEPPIGYDGDPRIYLLIANGLNPNVGGYFSAQHSVPQIVNPASNAHDMLIFNASAYDSITDDTFLATLAHEYQHLLRYAINPTTANWLNEAYSQVTERALGFDSGITATVSFLREPNTQLNTWQSGSFAEYGASLLFLTDFAETFGEEALTELSQLAQANLLGMENYITSIGGDFENFFGDWVLANGLMSPTTGYGYTNLWNSLPSASSQAVVGFYPYVVSGAVPQHATDYYTFVNLEEVNSLDIALVTRAETQLVSTSVPQDEGFYVSLPADNSHVSLRRTVDLTNVDSATLEYDIWHDLEAFWDYGYLLISGDGERWEMLATDSMTTDNPYGRAYGVGYTGQSQGWIHETVSLDAYIGEVVSLSFEVITDGAVTKQGMAIDNLSIPEIGWLDDAEMAGWIRTDNRLPQWVMVQAVQRIGTDIHLSRWMASGDETWTLDLLPNTTQVLLAITPLAPVTTVPMPYSLLVESR